MAKNKEKGYKEGNTDAMCIAQVSVDNYDELDNALTEEEKLQVATDIEKRINIWATQMNASLTKFKAHLYLLVFEKKYCDEQVRSKFNILDDIKQLDTPLDFPITLSIGIGIRGATPRETDEFAGDALDLALGRGGDQAVIKDGKDIFYFGGTTQAPEKANKGKSRIIGHALCRLIETSPNVVIMGHKNPDMDCFGSALGIAALALPINPKTYIVVNECNDALDVIYRGALAQGKYNVIKSGEAIAETNSETLVIILDTHRPSILECAELLEISQKYAIIDHHRKAEDFMSRPILSYMETYVSSTAEMVSEILQFTLEKKKLTEFEANALMAGMMVDTNRFSVKTGVRTFETAAWLKRCGANTAEVKKFFQTDLEVFKVRAGCIADARFPGNGVAVSVCEGNNTDAQIINSQVADELLTIKGIHVSFVAGRNAKGRTVISARSLGDINVQAIMEKFGGGGHLNTAGAQMDMSPEDAIDSVLKVLEKEK